jgi:hypothetical protein
VAMMLQRRSAITVKPGLTAARRVWLLPPSLLLLLVLMGLVGTVGKRVWGQHLVPINSLTNSHPHMLLNAAHPVSILHGIDGYLQPTLKVGHVLGVW